MTKDEQGQDLVSVQATFLKETCVVHRYGHDSRHYKKDLTAPMAIKFEAAVPDKICLSTLTCYWCGERYGIADLTIPSQPKGFDDDSFKRRRLKRRCLGCTSTPKKIPKISLHGEEFIRCVECDGFEPTEHLATVQEVHDLSAQTFQHFAVLGRATWPKAVWKLQVHARKNKQLCLPCFGKFEDLQTDYPKKQVCGWKCGAVTDLVSQEAMQKLSADIFIALTPFEPQRYWPSRTLRWEIQRMASAGEVVCEDCYANLTSEIGVTKRGTAEEVVAMKAAAEEARKAAVVEARKKRAADAADDAAGRATKRRALKRESTEEAEESGEAEEQHIKEEQE
jgi:hypothetical protein